MNLKTEFYLLKPQNAAGESVPSEVRKYLIRDLREVSSFYERYSEDFISNNLVAFLTENYKSEVNLLILRDEKNNILGFAVFSEARSLGFPFPSCFLKYLFVDPAFRGRGFGKLILQHLKAKFKTILVLVEEGEEKAKSFYEKQGFRFIAALPHELTGKTYWGFIWTERSSRAT